MTGSQRASGTRSLTLAGAAAGALAAAVAMGLSELIAGLVTGAPSLVVAIGDLIIDLQPPGAKDLMVDLFGTNDKLALYILIVGTALAVSAAVGVVGRRDWRKALFAFVVVGFVAAFAALREPLISPVLAIVTVVVSVGMALAVLRLLLEATGPAWATVAAGAGRPRSRSGTGSMPDWDRRRFLLRGGSVAAGAVIAGTVGRTLLQQAPARPTTGGLDAPLPSGVPSPSVAALPAGTSLDVAGLTPIVMPNQDFYRIDTALLVPRVDVDGWKLRVHGMVDREVVLTYADLLAMPRFDQYVTIACVSNKVGDALVGNARWTGVHLREVLGMAGVHPDATQIVGRSVDEFTVGFPTSWAMDASRDPMIALAMNGDPLPVEHGYPARMIVPGLYGYVSATKWLSEIELTTLEAFDAYWVPLGWAKKAPILTQSRIDVPRNGSGVTAGTVPIAGVAWAPDRGISKVEIKIDDGEWQPAQLSAPISKATWVQWKLDWAATAGKHIIEVRATDGNGEVQTADITPPDPDGARGHHTIQVSVA